MKYILKLTITLLFITAVVAGLLGLVNSLTADKIAENTAKKAVDAMQTVLPADAYEEMEVSKDGVSAAYKAENGYVVRVTRNGFGGAIDMMVGIDLDGKVTGISIISHSETASLGAECTREDFRAQFVGVSEAPKVTKDGGTIEALTGATVTSRAVADAVALALEFFKEVQP